MSIPELSSESLTDSESSSTDADSTSAMSISAVVLEPCLTSCRTPADTPASMVTSRALRLGLLEDEDDGEEPAL